MTTALCPGSFDPPTNGHLDVIERCIELFDSVVVGVVDNPAKSATFSTNQRVTMLRELVGDKARVASFSGLLVDFAAEVSAHVIVKGLRTVDDFEYESQMAQMNHHLTGIETVMMSTRAEYAFVSSSLVREVSRLGGSISGLVPGNVEQAFKEITDE